MPLDGAMAGLDFQIGEPNWRENLVNTRQP